jgi:hypothetical protein
LIAPLGPQDTQWPLGEYKNDEPDAPILTQEDGQTIRHLGMSEDLEQKPDQQPLQHSGEHLKAGGPIAIPAKRLDILVEHIQQASHCQHIAQCQQREAGVPDDAPD